MTRFWLTLDQAVGFVLARIQDMRGGEVFVPLTHTMKLTDLVEAVAPGCKVEVSGIRSGEKLDEILISKHEARQTVRFKDYLAVLPGYADVAEYAATTGSTLVERDFEYSSTDSSLEMSIEQMRQILEKEGI